MAEPEPATMETIHTPHAPQPAGHYSQGVVHNGVVYVAGQLPFDPERPNAPLGNVEEQTLRTLRNVEAVLLAAGSGLDRLLEVTVYVTDLSHWGAINEVYAGVLGAHRPARAVVPVGPLKRGALLEIQARGVVG